MFWGGGADEDERYARLGLSLIHIYDAKLEATAQSKAGMSLAALENALADAMYANAAAGKINTCLLYTSRCV